EVLEVVAGAVLAVLGELDREPLERAGMQPAQKPLDDELGAQVEPGDLADHFGAEVLLGAGHDGILPGGPACFPRPAGRPRKKIEKARNRYVRSSTTTGIGQLRTGRKHQPPRAEEPAMTTTFAARLGRDAFELEDRTVMSTTSLTGVSS